MALAKILGAQRDFSFGEVDVALKRADDHPARKAGLRQMSNWRILNSGAIQDRPGRSAIFPATESDRIEEVTMSPGNTFKIAFGASIAFGVIRIYDSSGNQVAYFATLGGGTLIPWTANTVNQIVFDQLGLSIYITYGHAMRPQVLTWDGVSTWSIADYTELAQGNQKRTAFYRISQQGISITPAAQTGAGVTISASAPVFTAGMVGTRIRFVERQILITGFTDSQHVTGSIQEALPGSQGLNFATDPRTTFNVGDIVIGASSGSRGIVTSTTSGAIVVQLLTTSSTTYTSISGSANTVAFVNELVVGPSGSLTVSSAGSIGAPTGCSVWDEEVMNDYRGYPASVFVDQFRVGFCDFRSVPGGISWSAINSPTDMYVGPNPSDAIFELAPDKVQVYYVVPGPESSEFVFCDRKIYYIKIDPQNPLIPGSVSFLVLSSDGAGQVQPRASQELILYANAGRSSMMAIIASGAYYRPFNTKNLSEFHSHLFSGITCIAVPTADGTFNERYAYVMNSDNSLVVGKYDLDDIASNASVIKVGWGPWSGIGAIKWVAAYAADVLFTTSYFGATICEQLDDSKYVDAAIFVNNLPAPFAAPPGKGPLWWVPSQTVFLMDQTDRPMGIYQIDANGFIVPQNNAGENLAAASLLAGQSWSGTAEPFPPDADPGKDIGQRMFPRRVARFRAYVNHSTGFVLGRLFSGKTTPTSPALGTLMNFRRFPAYNQGDDPTLTPPLRETSESIRPLGRSYDPRVALIKDTPGPLLVHEFALEVTV